MAVPLADFGPARQSIGAGSHTRTGPLAEDGGKALDEGGPSTAIVTYTGYPFDLLYRTTWCYDHVAQTNDIAKALANTTRYGGHVGKMYSVAEHSIRVADLLEAQGHDQMTQLLGLWHDATEAYLGDVPRPQKKLMSIDGTPFEEVEHDLALKLFEHFGIEYTEDRWAAVKAADYDVYVVEREERPFPAMVGKHPMVSHLAETYWHNRNAYLIECMNSDD